MNLIVRALITRRRWRSACHEPRRWKNQQDQTSAERATEKTYEATPPTIFATRSRGRQTDLSRARTARRSQNPCPNKQLGQEVVILDGQVLEAVALGKSLRLVRAARSLELRADPIAHADCGPAG